MKMGTKFGVGLALAVSLLTVAGWIWANAGAPPASKTDAPGENNCTQCHSGTANTGGGDATLVLGANAATYTPGTTYTVTVSVTDATRSRFGFQVTALSSANGASVGTFAVTNINNTIAQSGNVSGFNRTYVAHKNAGSNATWTFNWTAPSSNIGIITFYLVGNATDNNSSTNNDNVYTRTFAFAATPPPAPIAAFSPNSSTICPGNTIAFTDQTSNSPTTWQWSFPGGTPSTSTAQNPSVSYAAAGSYTVTLITSNSTGSDTLVQANLITVNPAPQLSASTSPVLCHGGTDGQIDLTVSASTGNTYHWSNNSSAEDPSGLAAGTYSVTVTSGAGCTATATYTITEPSALQVSTTSTLATCGNSNGTASASAAGGSPGYVYLWSTGATTPTINGLPAGAYTVTATDQHGCTSIATATVSNSGAPTGTASGTDATCHGDTDGSASINVTGGLPPYTYAWSNGATVASLSNLAAGTYNVTVMDASQCQLVASVTVSEPNALSISTSTTPDMGANQGSATATASGGNGGYAYLWSDGQSTGTATNLAAGNYTVTVTDSLGCGAVSNVTVPFAVGVGSKLPQNLFVVGPSPFEDYLVLRPSVPVVGSFVVHLIDTEGYIRYGDRVDGNGLTPIIVPTAALPSGIYLLMIVSDQGKFLQKVIKRAL